MSRKKFNSYTLSTTPRPEHGPGLTVVPRQPNELQIDIDDAFGEPNPDILKNLENYIGPYEVIETVSRNGNKHFTVRFEPGITIKHADAILYQALLGSDPVREFLNQMRLLAGQDTPVVFWEKSAPNDNVSLTPTPYATECRSCGLVYMTEEAYSRQMQAPDYKWVCMQCGQVAEWSDDNFEAHEEMKRPKPLDFTDEVPF